MSLQLHCLANVLTLVFCDHIVLNWAHQYVVGDLSLLVAPACCICSYGGQLQSGLIGSHLKFRGFDETSAPRACAEQSDCGQSGCGSWSWILRVQQRKEFNAATENAACRPQTDVKRRMLHLFDELECLDAICCTVGCNAGDARELPDVIKKSSVDHMS